MKKIIIKKIIDNWLPNSIKKKSQNAIEKDFSYGWVAAIASIAITGQAFPGLSSVLHSNLFRKASLVDLHFWHSCDNTVYSLWRNETKVDYGGKERWKMRERERERERENTIKNWYLKITILNHLSQNSNCCFLHRLSIFSLLFFLSFFPPN